MKKYLQITVRRFSHPKRRKNRRRRRKSLAVWLNICHASSQSNILLFSNLSEPRQCEKGGNTMGNEGMIDFHDGRSAIVSGIDTGNWMELLVQEKRCFLILWCLMIQPANCVLSHVIESATSELFLAD